mgnify:CR=1 FL=1
MKNTIIYRMKSRLITLLLLLITVSSVTFAQEAKEGNSFEIWSYE